MGRVRTKTTKRASRVLIEKYYPRLTLDFHTNKRIIDEVVRRRGCSPSDCAYHALVAVRHP
ncbi:hypothetical protein EIP86_003259 [Pleurotus ostreatoroseus]|nr:hypothetical protein EIP86_003259 [Pleurotus ostreatoroseus]